MNWQVISAFRLLLRLLRLARRLSRHGRRPAGGPLLRMRRETRRTLRHSLREARTKDARKATRLSRPGT
jgi:hypothetical protein